MGGSCGLTDCCSVDVTTAKYVVKFTVLRMALLVVSLMLQLSSTLQTILFSEFRLYKGPVIIT